MKKFLIFDFDGVIANTEKSNADYLARALAVYGITLSEEDRKTLIGTSDKSRLSDILRRSTVPVTWERLAETRREIGNTYENGDIRPMDGLVSMIRFFRERGIRTAIASSTSTKFIITALNRLEMLPLFDVIVCGDMCTRSKPDPEIYSRAMEYLEAEPEECVIIEDSTPGICAGRASGAVVMAYTGSGIYQNISEANLAVEDYGICKEKLLAYGF